MLQIAINFRAIQIFSQHAHNLCARLAFHQDHGFFSEVYNFADDSYDGIIERIIGTKGEEGLELKNIIKGVFSKLDKAPDVGVKENKVFYMFLLDQLRSNNLLIDQLCKSDQISEGTRQFLGNLADQSEIIIYKIQQRIK